MSEKKKKLGLFRRNKTSKDETAQNENLEQSNLDDSNLETSNLETEIIENDKTTDFKENIVDGENIETTDSSISENDNSQAENLPTDNNENKDAKSPKANDDIQETEYSSEIEHRENAELLSKANSNENIDENLTSSHTEENLEKQIILSSAETQKENLKDENLAETTPPADELLTNKNKAELNDNIVENPTTNFIANTKDVQDFEEINLVQTDENSIENQSAFEGVSNSSNYTEIKMNEASDDSRKNEKNTEKFSSDSSENDSLQTLDGNNEPINRDNKLNSLADDKHSSVNNSDKPNAGSLNDSISDKIDIDDNERVSDSKLSQLPTDTEIENLKEKRKEKEKTSAVKLAIECADNLEVILSDESRYTELENEIKRGAKILMQLAIEIDEPQPEDFVPESEFEIEETISADKLIEQANAIIAEAERLKKEMLTPIPDDIEEDYYFSDEEIDPEIGFVVHQPKDDLKDQEIAEEDFIEETEDTAYDIGIAEELDNYDREILSPVFENFLRMSTNSLKYRYSKIKNSLMSFSGISQKFDGVFENFRYSKSIIARLNAANGKLYIYFALPEGSLDKTVYPHKKAKGSHAKITPIVMTIKDNNSLARAQEVLTVLMASRKIVPKNHYVVSAYAERYPLNPNAVILGYEHIPPIEGEYDDPFEYEPISGEIVDGIIKEKAPLKDDSIKLTGKAKLDDIRQTATSIKASVALTEPIVYFYDAAIDASSNVQYINIQQVLNDKFFGKIVPQAYFAVAEGSDRIETLNFLALEHAIEQANANPGVRFVISVSVRLLLREKVFERLLRNAKTENDNLILAFDCALLEATGDIGLSAITKLRNECGSMIMIDNAENAGMKVLTEYDYEYLRFDARYYAADSPRQQAHMQMLAGYCKTQNIRSTSINVLNTKEAQTLIKKGVEVIQGFAVCEPKRHINLAVRGIKKIPPTS